MCVCMYEGCDRNDIQLTGEENLVFLRWAEFTNIYIFFYI